MVDYILCSTNLFERIIDFKVNTRCESDHFPISMTIRSGKLTAPVEIHDQHNSASIPRYRWTNDISNNFNSTLSELLSDFNPNQCMDLLNINIDFAVNRLTMSLQDCARLCGLQLTFSDVKHKDREMWYDKECEELKSRKFNTLNDFRLTGDLEDLSRYCQLRNCYRSMCRQKKTAYEESTVKELVDSCNDNKHFWKKLSTLTGTRKFAPTSINSDEWTEYFKDVLNLTDIPVDKNIIEHAEQLINNHRNELCDICCNDDINTMINSDVTYLEIESAINVLKQS